MSKNNYVIAVSGDREGRLQIIGTLVDGGSGLVREFIRNGSGEILFYFRYRGDARLILKRVAKNLTAEKSSDVDSFSYLGAEAKIRKIS